MALTLNMTDFPTIIGLVLAGGRARRFDGIDKCLITFGDAPLLEHIHRCALPQVETLWLNANGDPERFAHFAHTGLEIVPDQFPNYPGPLAGVHAGLQHMARTRPEAQWLASFAGDTPWFPDTLVATLYAAVRETKAPVAFACDAEGGHPTFALWHRSLAPRIEDTLNHTLHPRLSDWIVQQGGLGVPVAASPGDFFNINSPDDLQRAKELMTHPDEG